MQDLLKTLEDGIKSYNNLLEDCPNMQLHHELAPVDFKLHKTHF